MLRLLIFNLQKYTLNLFLHPHLAPYHDDSVHFDTPTTTLTPQTSSTMCWQCPIARDISRGLPRYIACNIICSTKMLKMLHLLL
jgi:hypothetical protein